jgi:hypothetical protein
MCRRGHSDRWARHRSNGDKYCRLCQSIAKRLRYNGLGGLPKPPSIRRKLDPQEFMAACMLRGLGKQVALRMSGHPGYCLGAYYKHGAGPQIRSDLSRALQVREQDIWDLA